MLTVGSSTLSGGSASTLAGSHRVSEMLSLSTPVKAMMSPARALSTSMRSRPRKPMICNMRTLRVLPSRSMSVSGVLVFTVPRAMRPMPMTPT